MKRLRSSFAVAAGAALFLPLVAGAQSGFNQTGAFVGAWCAQGDPSKRASITSDGPFNLNLTNESGATSTGIVSGLSGNSITAPQWNLVQGNLSPDGQTINWSNNTFWTRCSGRRYIDVQGTWYVGGDSTRPCRIDQRKAALKLRNETGQRGSGSFTSSHQIATTWSGTPISGTISNDQNRIDWSNGTYWTR
jgi:hypothetical protein